MRRNSKKKNEEDCVHWEETGSLLDCELFSKEAAGAQLPELLRYNGRKLFVELPVIFPISS